MSTRREMLAGLGLAASIATARAADPVRRPRAAAEVWARTELYFGTNKPGGGTVSEAHFMAFIDAEVTPRFPDGLTLLNGYGQFLSSSGLLIREESYVLILFYPAQTQDANQRIQAIRDSYKGSFQQESVLRVDSFSFVSF